MFTRFIYILFILLFNISLNAQSISKINGQVVEQWDGSPVFNALIVLNEDQGVYTLSDENGFFTIETPLKIPANLHISHLSYDDLKIEVQGDNLITVQLVWKPITTDEILVTRSSLGNVSQSDIIHDEIKSMGRQKNVADIFKDVNGFGVVKRGAYAMDPVFRAFKYEQINIQCDGGTKIMNACPNRMDPITTHIISEEVKKVELIKGPFSVRFGPNFGGVVNLVTQERPKEIDFGLHSSVQTGYELNGNSKIIGASVKSSSELYDFAINSELHDFGNYTDGKGEEVPSSFNSYDYSLKSGWNLDKNQRIQLVWRQSFGRDVLHAGLPMDTEHDNSTVVSLDYAKKNISKMIYSVTAKGYYSYVDHLMTNITRPNFPVVDAQSLVFATTYGGKMEVTLTPVEKVILYTGIDVNVVSREGDRIRTIKRNPKNPEIILPMPKVYVDSIWQDAQVSNVGVFGEGRYVLNSRSAFTGGIRMDFASSVIESPARDFELLYSNLDKKFELNLSGNLSWNYDISDKHKIQIATGRGVRSANMIERYINHFGVDRDPYEYVGNPDLKAEANHQIEFSFDGSSKKTKYGVNTYYSYITDYITAYVDSSLSRKFTPWVEPKVAKRFENADLITRCGFEAYVELLLLPDFTCRLDGSYVRANNEDLGQPLALIPPLTGMLTVTYTKPKYWLDLRARFVDQQNQISEAFGEEVTPSYETFDLRMGVRPIDGLSIGVGVLNIFDSAYYDHLTFSYKNADSNNGRIYEPGRNITIFVKYHL